MSSKNIKRLAIIGSTGSIGKQTLEVVDKHPDKFEVEVLVANNSYQTLIEQAKKYKPNIVVIVNRDHYKLVSDQLFDLDIKVYCGSDAVNQVVEISTVDTVVSAIVGCAGLMPTLKAIEAGKNVALANKEVLVVAGDIITDAVRRNKGNITPIDSEHSAIFQSLVGEEFNEIEKVILTCSGGPFFNRDREFLSNITREQALKHPKWDMGAKITIDSSTLMNKGLEVIEAKWLFDITHEQIDVTIHRESIIHSMVEFTDGSIKAQLGEPDMRVPIQYALSYPLRLKSDYPRVDFTTLSSLTFAKPDMKTFGCLELAYDALKLGGSTPCVLNAVNEITVDNFLKDKISFLQIEQINREIMESSSSVQVTEVEHYLEIDRRTRAVTTELINKL